MFVMRNFHVAIKQMSLDLIDMKIIFHIIIDIISTCSMWTRQAEGMYKHWACSKPTRQTKLSAGGYSWTFQRYTILTTTITQSWKVHLWTITACIGMNELCVTVSVWRELFSTDTRLYNRADSCLGKMPQFIAIKWMEMFDDQPINCLDNILLTWYIH